MECLEIYSDEIRNVKCSRFILTGHVCYLRCWYRRRQSFRAVWRHGTEDYCTFSKINIHDNTWDLRSMQPSPLSQPPTAAVRPPIRCSTDRTEWPPCIQSGTENHRYANQFKFRDFIAMTENPIRTTICIILWPLISWPWSPCPPWSPWPPWPPWSPWSPCPVSSDDIWCIDEWSENGKYSASECFHWQTDERNPFTVSAVHVLHMIQMVCHVYERVLFVKCWYSVEWGFVAGAPKFQSANDKQSFSIIISAATALLMGSKLEKNVRFSRSEVGATQVCVSCSRCMCLTGYFKVFPINSIVLNCVVNQKHLSNQARRRAHTKFIYAYITRTHTHTANLRMAPPAILFLFSFLSLWFPPSVPDRTGGYDGPVVGSSRSKYTMQINMRKWVFLVFGSNRCSECATTRGQSTYCLQFADVIGYSTARHSLECRLDEYYARNKAAIIHVVVQNSNDAIDFLRRHFSYHRNFQFVDIVPEALLIRRMEFAAEHSCTASKNAERRGCRWSAEGGLTEECHVHRALSNRMASEFIASEMRCAHTCALIVRPTGCFAQLCLLAGATCRNGSQLNGLTSIHSIQFHRSIIEHFTKCSFTGWCPNSIKFQISTLFFSILCSHCHGMECRHCVDGEYLRYLWVVTRVIVIFRNVWRARVDRLAAIVNCNIFMKSMFLWRLFKLTH